MSLKRMGVLASVVLATGCQSRVYNTETLSEGSKKNLLMVQCATPQGNGGNWGATLGWVAEDWKVLSERAQNLKAETGRNVYIYAKCFSGGSSGSGATNTVMNLFENSDVVSGTFPNGQPTAHWQQGFFTPEQLNIYADAMRFLALSIDMTITDTLFFAKSGIHEALVAKLSQADAVRLFIEGVADKALKKKFKYDPNALLQINTEADAHWWSDAVASADVATVDFAKLAHAARFLKSEHVESSFYDATQKLLSFSKIQKPDWNVFKEFIVANQSKLRGTLTGNSTMEIINQFAKEVNVKRVVDFPLAKAAGGLECGTRKGSCSIDGASGKLLFSDQSEKKTKTAEVRFAKFYMLEAIQAFYAGRIVDDLARKTKNGDKPVAPAPGTFETFDNYNTKFNAELNRIGVESASQGPFFLDRAKYSLTGTLLREMATGYVTVTTAAVHDKGTATKQSELKFYDTTPNLKDLRVVSFANDKTIQAIRQSKLFQRDTKACLGRKESNPSNSTDYPCRFYYAQVNQAVYSMISSVREPGLMNELYAPALGKWVAGTRHMGVVAGYDPRTGESTKFEAGKNGDSTYFAVTGGWPDRRIAAWPLVYFMDTLMSENQEFGLLPKFEKIVGPNSNTIMMGSFSIFGKPDRSSNVRVGPSKVNKDKQLQAKFDVSAVGSIFSSQEENSATSAGGETDADQNRQDYVTFFSEFYNFFRPAEAGAENRTLGFSDALNQAGRDNRPNGGRGVPVMLNESLVHWDMREVKGIASALSSVPAFLPIAPDGGASRYLVKLAHNGVREGIIALANDVDLKTGVEEQACSLARFEQLTTKVPRKVAGLNVPLFKRTVNDGKPTVRRLQCARRLVIDEALDSLRKEEPQLPTYKQMLAKEAANSQVTFNATDARMDNSRKDYKALLTLIQYKLLGKDKPVKPDEIHEPLKQ